MTVDPVHSDMYETDFTVDIDPVFKQNWKTGEARDYWEPVLDPFDAVKGQLVVQQALNEDHPRDGGYLVVTEEDLADTLSWLNTQGLHFKKIRDITVAGHHQAVSQRNTELQPGGSADFEEDRVDMAAVAFGNTDNDIQVLEAFGNSVSEHNNRSFLDFAFGANFEKSITVDGFDVVAPVLGIPDCCREFVADLDTDNGLTHPLYEIACNTPSAEARDDDPEDIILTDPDPMLNVFWSYLDFSFIQYFPCSFECEASHEAAVATGSSLRELEHDRPAEMLHKWLSLPMTWTGYNGIAEVRNAYAIGAYVTSDYWQKKRVVWGQDHAAKPELSSIQLPVRDW